MTSLGGNVQGAKGGGTRQPLFCPPSQSCSLTKKIHLTSKKFFSSINDNIYKLFPLVNSNFFFLTSNQTKHEKYKNFPKLETGSKNRSILTLFTLTSGSLGGGLNYPPPVFSFCDTNL